jgi:hypothetical protein
VVFQINATEQNEIRADRQVIPRKSLPTHQSGYVGKRTKIYRVKIKIREFKEISIDKVNFVVLASEQIVFTNDAIAMLGAHCVLRVSDDSLSAVRDAGATYRFRHATFQTSCNRRQGRVRVINVTDRETN